MVDRVYTSVYPWNGAASVFDYGYKSWLGRQPTSRRWRSAMMRRRLWVSLGMDAAELLG